MFTSQVAVISNKATWRSDVYEVVDDQDDTITDLNNPLLDVNIVVTIRGLAGAYNDYGNAPSPSTSLATASIANGKVTIPGPGFQWQFEDTDLSGLCSGTYTLGAKVTIDDYIQDIIIGTIAVIQGN